MYLSALLIIRLEVAGKKDVMKISLISPLWV
jgi:hypothetical protein